MPRMLLGVSLTCPGGGHTRCFGGGARLARERERRISKTSGSGRVSARAKQSSHGGGANSIDCYFGDFSRSVVTGDRMSFEFDTDSSIYFTSYAVAIRGVERYHTVVHDVGTGTAPGPVVCLIQS